MRRRCELVLCALVWLTAPAVCLGQDVPRRSSGIHGVVRGKNGQRVLRAHVCGFRKAPLDARCAVADTAGRFGLDSLYPGTYVLRAECETGRATFNTRLLDTVRVVVRAHDQLTIDFAVPTVGCDQRPYEIVRGEVTGHWASGFELDDFVPCSDSTKHAWVERRGLAPGELWQLPAGDSVESGTRWFVRWRGVWIGPRSMLPPYHMVVDEVLEMRPPQATDCGT